MVKHSTWVNLRLDLLGQVKLKCKQQRHHMLLVSSDDSFGGSLVLIYLSLFKCASLSLSLE